jgi:pyruvate ferredoxin oxidoreductase beta subunit
MALNLKELASRPERFSAGHRACAGCGFPLVIKMVLGSIKEPIVAACATGCMEVTSTIFPYTAWEIPFIHNAFENSAATMSGVEAAYQSLKRQGKIDKDIRFVAFGGDGGTYDIGFQSLSGAMERGHNMVYVCYDNGAYMNTGIQRSSATPRGSHTTTTPAGKVGKGKQQYRKDLALIMAAHGIPYVAQASVGDLVDLARKAEKAFNVDGPAFLNVLTPCRLGWNVPADSVRDIAKEATDACFWPLFEVENGKWKVNYKPKNKIAMDDWMKQQGRFKHLFAPGNEDIRREIQEEVDRQWEALLKRAEEA